MTDTCPFLISIPHGGTEIPEYLRPHLALSDEELLYHCDPFTRDIFNFGNRVTASIDTPLCRMIVDLNRPPLPLPPRDPDGIIKSQTPDGKKIYHPDQVPGIRTIHKLMLDHYFPYHQEIDNLIDAKPVRIAFDCHSMLPFGLPGQKDAGKARPCICLGNNGDGQGEPHAGSITTCPPGWIRALADRFSREFSLPGSVAINDPFSGGFITNAHYWHKGVPWIQIEVNRSLYEIGMEPGCKHACKPGRAATIPELRETIENVLRGFWDEIR